MPANTRGSFYLYQDNLQVCSIQPNVFTFVDMKHLPVFLSVIILAACNDAGGYKKAEDAQDAGREFIRASLNGDMDKARFYLLKDSTNLYVFESWKNGYNKLSGDEKRSYRESEIRPLKIEKVSDSIVNYSYSNSFKQKKATIKVVRVNGEWLVDLKDIH